MVGELQQGPRAQQQFVSTDAKAKVRTYSRSCTVEQGEFVIVRVPLRDGREDRTGLATNEVHFVARNETPAEHRARRRAK